MRSHELPDRAPCGRALFARLACSLAAAAAASACDLSPTDTIGGDTQSIIGGQEDIGDPAVVYLSGSTGLCTGTLVADNVVLTAAHCLPQNTVYFGPRIGEFIATRHVVDQVPSRFWKGIDEFKSGGDIALLRLDSAAPTEIEPMPINTDPLLESDVGRPLHVVGFGTNDAETEGGVGTKRYMDVEVNGVTPEHITYGTEFMTQCHGDSGGPSILDFDGTERVVGVNSYGDCAGQSRGTRADVYYSAFLEEVIDAWSGPCRQDFDCVTDGCRTPDPDCDVCGFDGVCATGCETKDLDCPVSGFQGDPCNDREDCETLLCLESPEDPRVKYCSTECDPDNLDDFWSCQTPLSACVDAGDGKDYCRFTGITPGVQGYECTEQTECRSSICYPPGEGFCAEQCGDGLPACAEPYSCENIGAGVDACILPEGGGCCQTSGSRSGRTAAGMLLLAGLVGLLLGLRRRRAHQAAVLACLVGLGIGTAACDMPEVDPIAERAQPIIGGQVDIGDPAVLYLSGSSWGCTGTLVADTVVLTAAHCVPINQVHFGNALNDFFDSRRVVQQIISRYYDPAGTVSYKGDIALLRLESAAPVEVAPIPINTEPLDDSYIGAEVRAVGFGVTDGSTQTGAGTKRFVNLELKGVSSEHLTYGTEFTNICQGDSGGPTFLDFDGTERLVSVSSFVEGACDGESYSVRADVYYDAFLQEVIDAWSGPCKQDFDCVTDGCRTPDPDCDVCGYDGVCATGCERKDLDCPVSGFQGDPCNDREDCESLICLESPEDPRVKYCSAECDPDNLGDFWSCQPPLSKCVDAGDGKNYCRFSGITPGVQGYECTEHSDCRSSICYPPNEGICAEQCGDGLPACAEPYSCESIGEGVDACILPEGGGCCQTSGARSGRTAAGMLLLAALVALLLVARRRGRPRRTAP